VRWSADGSVGRDRHRLDVVDPEVMELCARCLAGAAAHQGSEDDLALAATALAADLSDTRRADAGALLDAASRRAAAHLDDSDLDGHAFAGALIGLARLRLRVAERLATRLALRAAMPTARGTR
jgi:hypothetical protein